MRAQWFALAFGCSLLTGVSGCAPGILWACVRPGVTAVSLNPCDGAKCGKETGIPFYLPKPLLIVAKNFRNIEEAKTGLTDTVPIPSGYDDQAKYADLNARTNFAGLQTPLEPKPGETHAGGDPNAPKGTADKSAPYMHSAGAPISPRDVPSDGLSPATFYTYQIVFIPDMTQKYGLKIRGGPGEIRAAMNLVNGWQFTGIGPFYMKDSATAQNILAQGISTRLGGQAAADVLRAAADLGKVLGPGATQAGGGVDASRPEVQKMAQTLEALPKDCVQMSIPNFAEIQVYEPHLTADGRMEWIPIVNLSFNREYLGQNMVCVERQPLAPMAAGVPTGPGGTTQTGGQPSATGAVATVDPALARAAVAAVFGVAADSPALSAAPTTQAGGGGAVPAGGGINQIQVDVDRDARPTKEFNVFKFGRHHKAEPARPRIQTRTLTLPGALTAPAGLTPPGQVPAGVPRPGGPAGSPMPPADTPPKPSPGGTTPK